MARPSAMLSMLEDLARRQARSCGRAADNVQDVVGEGTKEPRKTSSHSSTTSSAPVLKEAWARTSATKEPHCKAAALPPTTHEGLNTSFATSQGTHGKGERSGRDLLHRSRHPGCGQNSPQLEVFKKKGIEVLLMTDRVDEWALNYLHDFDGTPLQSVAKGAVDLGKLQNEEEKKAAEEAAEAFKPVLAKLKGKHSRTVPKTCAPPAAWSTRPAWWSATAE